MEQIIIEVFAFKVRLSGIAIVHEPATFNVLAPSVKVLIFTLEEAKFPHVTVTPFVFNVPFVNVIVEEPLSKVS